jgi:hypothetical protein
VPGSVRYADDLVLFGDDKELLWQWRDLLADDFRVEVSGNELAAEWTALAAKFHLAFYSSLAPAALAVETAHNQAGEDSLVAEGDDRLRSVCQCSRIVILDLAAGTVWSRFMSQFPGCKPHTSFTRTLLEARFLSSRNSDRNDSQEALSE